MNAKNGNFSVLFASLEQYKIDNEYSEIEETIVEAQRIKEQIDLLNFITTEEHEEQVTYTRS